MRLYAFLLLASFAFAARAASIPESVAPAVLKKVEVVTEEKTPENVSSEQELIDQTNAINDVDNKLRVKPADIPVAVVVENVEPALKVSDEKESEEIIRPPVDLRNPGPPQRQEHETQNPEFYASEQQIVQTYKQNINDAQTILRQGFQGVSEGIQNMFENNEQIKQIQQSIQSLREGFIAQINKLNGTIQTYLNADNTNTDSATEIQTKANFQKVETGLNALKNEFTRGVKTLADGVDVIAYLRAENDKPEPTTGAAAAPAPANPAPVGLGDMFLQYINRLQTAVQNGFTNLQQTLNPNLQTSTAAAPPAGAQSDTPAAPAPAQQPNPWLPNFQLPNFNFLGGNQAQSGQPAAAQPGAIGSGNGPFAAAIQNFQSSLTNLWPQNWPGAQNPQGAQTQQPAGQPATQPAKPAESATTEEKPSEQTAAVKPESKPEEEVKPVAQASQAAPVTPGGPIRQILQNNPISQSIAGAVQRLQNMNNPEKPRDPEKQKETEKPAEVQDKHSPGSGDHNNSVSDRVEESEPMKEVQKETVTVVEEPKKEEEVKEQKAPEVVDKTE